MNVRKPYNNTRKSVALGSIWMLGGEVLEKHAVRTESATIASKCTHCWTQYIYSKSLFAHYN